MTSAYGKAKTAITSPFSTTPEASTAEASANTTPGTKSTIGPELYVMNGQLQESQGNYTKALDSYSKALEIEPKNPSALLSTARLYERQNEKDKALEFYQKASNVAPNNAAIFADIGSLHVRNGNLNQAKSELQKAVNLDPKNPNYRSAMAGVLLDSGNADGAMSELVQVYSPAMANYQMAYLHFTRKNIPATQQYLGSALQIDPNLKPARDLMASMGGSQNISQIAQQGQNSFQQVQGIYNQATAIGSNIQGLMNTQPQSNGFSAPGYVPNGTNAVPTNGATIPNSGPGLMPASYENAGNASPTMRR